MSGAIHLFPPYAIMAWTGTTLHFPSLFRPDSYVKWATVVVQCHKISNTTEIMHTECLSTANMVWPLTPVRSANKKEKQ